MKSKCFIIKSILKECLIIPSTNLIAVTLEMGFAVRLFFQVSINSKLILSRGISQLASKWQSFFLFYFLFFVLLYEKANGRRIKCNDLDPMAKNSLTHAPGIIAKLGVPKSSANSATICASLIGLADRVINMKPQRHDGSSSDWIGFSWEIRRKMHPDNLSA